MPLSSKAAGDCSDTGVAGCGLVAWTCPAMSRQAVMVRAVQDLVMLVLSPYSSLERKLVEIAQAPMGALPGLRLTTRICPNLRHSPHNGLIMRSSPHIDRPACSRPDQTG